MANPGANGSIAVAVVNTAGRDAQLLRGTEHGVDLLFSLRAAGCASEPDLAALAAACWDIRAVRDRQELVRRGENLDYTFLIIKGWAARAKVLSDGERRITGFLLPGDLSDFPRNRPTNSDHAIIALTPLRVAYIPWSAMNALARQRPSLRLLFEWSTTRELAILRAWLENVGRRSASGRVAHLICELHERLGPAKCDPRTGTSFPVTQAEIADALGLTTMHVNRVFRDFRENGVIQVRNGRLEINDHHQLASIGKFSPDYLHHDLS